MMAGVLRAGIMALFLGASLAYGAEKFDPEALKGDYNVKLKVLAYDGTVPKGEKWVLRYSQPDGRLRKVQSGTISKKGVIKLEDLAGGHPDAPVFSLVAGERERLIATLQLTDPDRRQEYEVMLPPKAGDTAPDIGFQDLFTDERLKLSDFRGQVVYLDFWASWCGPCQGPMSKNSELLAERTADWDGKAVIIAFTVDNDLDTARAHVKDKGWTNMVHVYSTEGGKNWKSEPAQVFGLYSIPTVYLIDQDGVIRQWGHPDAFDVERLIDERLEE